MYTAIENFYSTVFSCFELYVSVSSGIFYSAVQDFRDLFILKQIILAHSSIMNIPQIFVNTPFVGQLCRFQFLLLETALR